MSVWPNPSLATSEGELFSVSITVEPRRLEALLEALAHASFPINPRIRHGAITVVDFPAYANRITEIQGILAAFGFASADVHATPMLKEIRVARAQGGE
jgi:hypothetical protein